MPPLVEYCRKTDSGVPPLISGDSQGLADPLSSACLYSKLTFPPFDTSIEFEVKVLGQEAFAIHR